MEIQVGEYVRTNNGQIFKVLEVEKGSVKIKSDYREWIGICCIKKHSFDITDLIEIGDYINGDRVFKITRACIYLKGKAPQHKSYESIKSIVTKEMFESIKYEV